MLFKEDATVTTCGYVRATGVRLRLLVGEQDVKEKAIAVKRSSDQTEQKVNKIGWP